MATCKNCLHYEACMIVLEANRYDEEVGEGVDKRCKAFTDKSRFIELPCKVGDTVYIVDGITDDIVIGTITNIEQNIYTTPREWITVKGNYPFFGWLDTRDRIDLLLGKTVFFSREEAEAALAEWKIRNE